MDARNNDFDFDFTPIGQAIRKTKTAKGMTRDELSRIVDYDPRHLQAIENEGQKLSLELFIQLVTMFGVSVDEYIFPDNKVKKSSVRRRCLVCFSALRLSEKGGWDNPSSRSPRPFPRPLHRNTAQPDRLPDKARKLSDIPEPGYG